MRRYPCLLFVLAACSGVVEPPPAASYSPTSVANDALARAQVWVEQKVMYSWAPNWQGYRTDCSGLVSFAWGLPPPGHLTYSFAGGPWDDGASTAIGWDELAPGDALDFPGDPSSGTGHDMLFAGWIDDAHTAFDSYEEHDFGFPAERLTHELTDAWGTTSAIRDAYLPIRLTAGANCGAGDGLYCGGDGVPGDARTLYRCTGGVASVETVCAAGCVSEPTGVDDRCR